MVYLNREKSLHLAKTHFLSVVFSTGFFVVLIRATYHYFKKTDPLPWDSDLIIIIAKYIWVFLSYSKDIPLSLIIMLVIVAISVGYFFKSLSSKKSESDQCLQYFRKWKNLYWKIKCIFLDGTICPKKIEGPYCPNHKILLRSDHTNFRCDFDNCRYEIWERVAYEAEESLNNLARSNPKLLMTQDCEPF